MASSNANIVGEDIPDLTKMPGFTVLTGEARILAGAAAETKTPPHRELDD